MDAEKLRVLLRQREKPNLEFKLRYELSGQGLSRTQDEFAKDVVALANAVGRDARGHAHLVIGAGDELDSRGQRQREDVRKYGYTAERLLRIVNERCDPPLADLEYEEIEFEGTAYGVLTIPPTPQVLRLSRDLITPKGTWRKHSVLTRHGDQVEVAHPDEIVEMIRQRDKWRNTITHTGETPSGLIEPLAAQIKAFVALEIKHVNDECIYNTQKSIDDFFVLRSFARREPFVRDMPEESADEDELVTSPEPLEWHNVLEQLDIPRVVVVLGSPGFGKTVLLLKEVQDRSKSALEALERGVALGELRLAAYVHANSLSGCLKDPATDIVDCITRILSRRHGLSVELQGWLRERAASGSVLLAVDAIDEVSEERGDILRAAFRSYVNSETHCPLVFTSRSIGYSTPVPIASEWQLLEFSPKQRQIAATKWFGRVEIAKDFSKAIKDAPPLGGLLNNPLLLMLACKALLRAPDKLKAPSPDGSILMARTRSALYEYFVDGFKERWKERIKQKSGMTPSDTDQAEFIPFMEEVAWTLWVRDPRARQFTG